VTGSAVGVVNVYASSADIRGSVGLRIVAPELVSLSISAPSRSMPLGERQALAAIGRFSDGSSRNVTDAVNWVSASPAVISVNRAGLATAVGLGESVIAASHGGVKSSTTLTVTQAELLSITINPQNPVIPLAATGQFTVTGLYSDGSSRDVTSSATWTIADSVIASVNATGTVLALQVGATSMTATAGGASASTAITVQPLAAVAYFSQAPADPDAAIRVTNPGSTGGTLCANVYVFDQDQQMTACCGCTISTDGLRTLSLTNDLLANPLTGIASHAGSVVVVPSGIAGNSGCNAAAITPAGLATAWVTHTESMLDGQLLATEDPFSVTPLSATFSAAAQAQCSFIQQLGSGHGICTCGSGD